jgi:hypothetical protein
MLVLSELHETLMGGAVACAAVLALAFALGTLRNSVLAGLAAAFAAFAATQMLWALSTPHSAWINLIFQLFPAPVVHATAWLVALYAALGMGLRAGGFALGFAAFEAIAGAVSLWAGGAVLPTLLLTPVLVFAIHALLSLAAFAMATRQWPPFAIFCVLAIFYGAHHGGLIALARALPLFIVLAIEGVLAALYATGAYALLRQMPAAAKIG